VTSVTNFSTPRVVSWRQADLSLGLSLVTAGLNNSFA